MDILNTIKGKIHNQSHSVIMAHSRQGRQEAFPTGDVKSMRCYGKAFQARQASQDCLNQLYKVGP
jgi:hypothetical protein